MKKYLILSTLSYVLVFVLIELIMSSNTGYNIYSTFNWFIEQQVISLKHTISWFAQGLALSFAAYLYMKSDEKISSGLRFGIITGMLFSIIVLFNMMWQVEPGIYTFFAESLLPLSVLYAFGFAIVGWFFGLIYEIYPPLFRTNRQLWSLG